MLNLLNDKKNYIESLAIMEKKSWALSPWKKNNYL